MSKHTKGPWEVVRTDAGIIVRTESVKKTRAGASRYAAIGGFDRSDPEQLAEALANARLIAAAPELLEALEYLTGECDKEMDLDYNRHAAPLAKALAAIAKAKGEQQ
jgi:transketolase